MKLTGLEYRTLYRGGDGSDDWGTQYRDTKSCQAFCVSVMQPSSLVGSRFRTAGEQIRIM